jgi:hypothetical protein
VRLQDNRIKAMNNMKVFDKNLKVSTDIHKKLKILSINMGCRIDFLSDFALDYFLDHHDVGNLNENKKYKKALAEYSRMKLIVIK